MLSRRSQGNLQYLTFIVVLLCMTGNDSNQSPRMYFVLLGITFLVRNGDPARGRVVVDVVVVPGV